MFGHVGRTTVRAERGIIPGSRVRRRLGGAMKRSSALAIMFLIVLAACQAQAPQGPASKAGGQWVVSVTEEPDTLDAHKSTTALSDTILRYVGDPRIAKDQSGKNVTS